MITGVQVSSLKPLLTTEPALSEAFEKLRDMGCAAVQLQWIDPSIPASAIARALRASSLSSVSVQDFYETIRENKDYYITLNRLTGGTWLCVSRIPERLKSRAGLDQYICELRALQDELAAHHQRLCLHPVGADFEPFDGLMDPVQYLLDNMPELSLCADLYHLNKRRIPLSRWIGDHAGRICMIHFKDEKGGLLVPAGQGDTDWTGVVAACVRARIPYAFVEQETWSGDPFACLREALCWLNAQLPA